MSPSKLKKLTKRMRNGCPYGSCWRCSRAKVVKFKAARAAAAISAPTDRSDPGYEMYGDEYCDCESCISPYVRTASGLLVIDAI